MYSILEKEEIETDPDHDGDFFNQMQKKRWRHEGKQIADWVKFYEARLSKTAELFNH